MAYSDGMPQGPGFLLLFQNYRTSNPEEKIDSDRILKDDNEILEIITMVMNCDGVSGLFK